MKKIIKHHFFYDKLVISLQGDNTNECCGIIDQMIAMNRGLV